MKIQKFKNSKSLIKGTSIGVADKVMQFKKLIKDQELTKLELTT